MENYTKNGLLLILIGLIVGAIVNLALGLYQYINPVDQAEDFLRYIVFGIFGGIGGLISLVGGILFLVGRKEFGEKHQKFVIYALICIVVGIVVSIAVSIGSTIVVIMGSESGDFSGVSSTMFLLPSIIGAFTGGLAYVFALYNLEDEIGKRLLYVAFVVSIMISALILFISAGAVEKAINEASEMTSPEDLSSISSITTSVSEFAVYGVISSLLWALVIYLPYKRINNGELIPQSVTVFGSSSQTPERVCPNCNKEIPMDSMNCPYCGKHFENFL